MTVRPKLLTRAEFESLEHDSRPHGHTRVGRFFDTFRAMADALAAIEAKRHPHMRCKTCSEIWSIAHVAIPEGWTP